MFIPGFGSGKNRERLILLDSEKEVGAIAPGESKEKYISLKSGVYNIMTYSGRLSESGNRYDSEEKYGYLYLDFVTDSGERVASSQDSFVPGMVDFYLPLASKLKIKVSREGGTDRNKIHFHIIAHYTPDGF